MHEESTTSTKITVFISHRESVCGECGNKLGSKAWITLRRDKGALCLSCADLDHLEFLASGYAALTRRAGKYSTLSAVVLKWSTARKRYERQGTLVEEQALVRAEDECLADSDVRERRRQLAAVKREYQDGEYIERFASRVRELFPGCPRKREHKIAEHACQKYSGRIGRSAAAKSSSDEAVHLAVVAHVRHTETDYDRLLSMGYDRSDARMSVAGDIERVIAKWKVATDQNVSTHT